MSGGETVFSGRSEILATHDLRVDPTHALSSVYRETCAVCGAAALQARSGPIYGRAADYTCGEISQLANAVTHS